MCPKDALSTFSAFRPKIHTLQRHEKQETDRQRQYRALHNERCIATPANRISFNGLWWLCFPSTAVSTQQPPACLSASIWLLVTIIVATVGKLPNYTSISLPLRVSFFVFVFLSLSRSPIAHLYASFWCTWLKSCTSVYLFLYMSASHSL